MSSQEFFDLCQKHILHAKAKHPLFAHQAVSCPVVTERNYFLDKAIHFKRLLQSKARLGKASIELVLLSEMNEFMHEVFNGNIDRAKEEAADVVAVLFRAIEWMNENKEDDEDEEEDDDAKQREIDRECWEDLKVDEAVEKDQARRAGEPIE